MSEPHTTGFSVGQVAAVRAAFSLAGWDGDLRTLTVDSGDERLFVLPQVNLPAMRGLKSLEQVLSQLLGRTAWVIGDLGQPTVPFP
jgi:hypothetical protein